MKRLAAKKRRSMPPLAVLGLKLTLSFFVLFFVPAVTWAGGVNLRWSNCFGEGSGSANRIFNCGLCSGNNVLVASFVPPVDVPAASSLTATVSIVAATSSLPAWWDFTAVTGCRPNSLSANSSANPNDLTCVDWSEGQMTFNMKSFTTGIAGPNTARATLTVSVPEGVAFALHPTAEYFALNMTINNLKTNGTGACTGCDVGVCLFLNSVRVGQALNLQPILVSGSGNGIDSDLATWQGSGNAQNCIGATPARRATWAEIKATYRGP